MFARQKEGTPEQLAQRRQRHREAQARYRERNRSILNLRAVQYRYVLSLSSLCFGLHSITMGYHRYKKKRALEIAKDEEEYQRLMALE